MTLTATKFRADLYRVLQEVIESGTPVDVELRGRTVRVVPAEPPDRLANLVKRPGVLVGNAGLLPGVKTFDEKKWRKKWDRRLK